MSCLSSLATTAKWVRICKWRWTERGGERGLMHWLFFFPRLDRAWSILPAIHAWHYCYHDYLNRGAVHPRLFLAAFLITLWGWRLTLNFARKGGYSWGGQDYRYPYIKAKIGPVAMGFLNLFVINIFQNALLALLTTPLWFTLLTYIPEWEAKLNWMDLGISVLFLSFLLIEGIADEQQYKFQTEKHALLKHVPRDQLTGDYRRGFLTTGLFRYSRHANFCAEMGIWWTVYLFSLNSMWTLYRDIEEPMNMLDPRSYINWTICGPVVLTMLFQGSTWLTETISAEKYPEYASYMASVSRIIPWKPRSPLPPSKETKEA
ncbi:hypothetical protein BC940DRAFT_312837 [Gongronella butleri]|nr:hypothetical protein BC940DRAFT_312837 [Gongronella butleri]